MFLDLFLWLALVFLALAPVFHFQQKIRFVPAWKIKLFNRRFLLLLAVALLVWRTPEILFNAPYNSDESQFISVAQIFPFDAVPLRSGDGMTVGPLDSYILTWVVPLGLPFSYPAARLTGVTCKFITLVFLFMSISSIVGRRWSPLLVLPLITFYLFGWDENFVRYASEDLPVALLSISGWLLLVLWRRPDWIPALFLGVILGAIPFAKLQASPLAIYLFAISLLLIGGYFRIGLPVAAQASLRTFLTFIGGSLFVPILIMVPIIVTGTWPDFLRRYILDNMTYGYSTTFTHTTSYSSILYFFILKRSTFFLNVLGFGTLMILLKLIFRKDRFDRTWLTGLAIGGGYVLLIVFVILKPQNPFLHYLLLLPPALLLFTAWTLRGMRGGTHPLSLTRQSTTLPLLFCFSCVLAQAIVNAPSFYQRPYLSDRPPADPVTPVIKALSQPGDTLAIWGWAPIYFVQTGLRSATRDVIDVYDLNPAKCYDYYRDCYIHDLKKTKPRIFIDAAGTGYYCDAWPHPVEKARYTMYPPLATYIDAHYHLQSEIMPQIGGPSVRIFVRND